MNTNTIRSRSIGPPPTVQPADVTYRYHDFLAFCLAVILYYSHAVSFLHSLLTPVIVLLALIWAACDSEALMRRSYGRSALVATYAAFGILFCRAVTHSGDALPGVTLERFTVLLPLSAIVGWALVRCGQLYRYLRWQLTVGAISVAPALYEWLSGHDIFHAGAVYARNGVNRAVVGSEHPLVLGAFFLSLMPIAVWLLRRPIGRIVAAWLYLGVWTTGSNGAEFIGAVLLVLLLIPPLMRRIVSAWYWLIGLLALIGCYLAVGGIWLWSRQIHGTSTTAVSTGYREALYHLLPEILSTRPLGYGLSGLPPNTWYVGTQVSGIRDISQSIDSELVASVANFGYPALVGYILVAVIGASAALRHSAVGLSSLAVTLVGLFLAIHAWTSLGCSWFMGIGACAALLWEHDRASRRTALTDWRGGLRYAR